MLISANRLARSCAYSASAPEWEQFVRHVTPVVALAARRVSNNWGDPSHATISEIVQEVFVKLCEADRKILREFDDRGNESFVKLLRMITVSVATDYFRRSKAEKRGGHHAQISLTSEFLSEGICDSSATAAVEWPTLVAQLDHLLLLYPAAVSNRDRTLFWLYYRQGLTAEAISRIPSIGLSAKGVESALLRLTKLLKKTIQEGKPKQEIHARKLSIEAPMKGFSGVVAIDNMKRR